LSTPSRQTEPPKERPATQVSDARRATVEAAREVWIRKLIDLSRRNSLLYYRPLKTGTLEFSSAPPERLRELLAGESVPANKLLPDLEDEAFAKLLRDISRRSLENLEEKGLSTLFLTFGMATWPATDGGRAAESPVLLLPVSLSKREGSNSYHLAATGAFQINLVLLHVLQEQFRVTLHPDEVLTQFAGDPDQDSVFDVKGLCDEIQRRMSEVREFEVGLRVILGNFAFQKMAMVKDLQERATELAVHDVIAAIAGDPGAKGAINAEQKDPDPKEFDSIPPENEFLVLDADSSQQRAIVAVVAGQSRVIHGPPGTGKSQTITNLIASLAAAGRRILFVAEKKAALDVVKRRLEEVGLGHLAIVLHGADLSPKKVMQQVAHTLEVVRKAVPVDCQGVHSQLVDRRNRLNEHVGRMHTLREPTQKSVYEMQGTILRLSRSLNTSTRWRSTELSRLTPPIDGNVYDLLTEGGGMESLFLRTDPSPWTGAVLPDGAAVQQALDLAMQMHERTLPDLQNRSTAWLNKEGCSGPAHSSRRVRSLVSWRQHKKYCRRTLRRFLDAISRWLFGTLRRGRMVVCRLSGPGLPVRLIEMPAERCSSTERQGKLRQGDFSRKFQKLSLCTANGVLQVGIRQRQRCCPKRECTSAISEDSAARLRRWARWCLRHILPRQQLTMFHTLSLPLSLTRAHRSRFQN